MGIIKATDILTDKKIALIVSRFNEEITEALYHGAKQRLVELSFSEENLTTVQVPGCVEIPLTAQRLAQTQQYDAIIALGAVIQGETKHFDYVCQQVSDGCLTVSLNNNLPVIFGVLTTDNIAQARARVDGQGRHKGRDAANTAVEMLSVLKQISE